MEKKEKVEVTKSELDTMLKDMVQASIGNTVADEVKSAIEKAGLDKVSKNGMPVFGKTADQLEKLDSKEKTVELFKALYHKDTQTLASFKALNRGDGSAGGFLVPTEFSADVHRLASDYGLVARFATRRNMSTDSRLEPREASSVTVTYPGENNAGTESEPVFEQVELAVKDAVGITAISNSLLADADTDVYNMLAKLFAEAMGVDLDSQGLTGNGSPFTGILNDSGVNVTTMGSGDTDFTDADYDDLVDLRTSVKATAMSGAGYIVHRTVWGSLRKKKDSQGQYLSSGENSIIRVSQGLGIDGEGAGKIAIAGSVDGYPILLSDQMPATSATAVSTKFAIFGNLEHLLWGDRQQMGVAISDSATLSSSGNLFEKNMSAVRVVDRRAIAVAVPSAFAVLKTAAS